MDDFTIEQVDGLPSDIERIIDQGHAEYERDKGIACNYNKFSIVIKNGDDETVGALIAYTAYVEIYIDDIWIKPEYRGNNLGRRLLEDLEGRFKGKGYNNINLVTSEFQAPEFYKKCGFEKEFVRINKHNPKLTKTFFIKYFEEAQTQGVLPHSKSVNSEIKVT